MKKILPNLDTILRYAKIFKDSATNDGWRVALRRTYGFLRNLSAYRNFHREIPYANLHQDIICSLKTAVLPRPLLLIISDTEISQCIHYRIRQKERYLQAIGLQTMYLFPAEQGRIQAFMSLAHTVIIYRSVISPKQIAEFQNSGVRLIFEFDDLIVGSKPVVASGILPQLTERQSRGLMARAPQLLETAQACDEIIVSTPYLADQYARPENGLANKPCHVIPNFVEIESYKAPGEKDVTFAFTSPSHSIRDELKMLSGFLVGYDAATEQNWSIQVLGNDYAFRELSSIAFVRGTVLFQPFSSYEDYLESIARAQTVLIPLSDSRFNRSKTPIRLMDAAISGTQALFCPIGAYQGLQLALSDGSLCIPCSDWENAGHEIAPVLARQHANVADLQNAVRALYGSEAAIACYREVFTQRMALLTGSQTEVVKS